MTSIIGGEPSIHCPAATLGPAAQGIARVAVLDATAQLVVSFERTITAAQQAYLLTTASYTLTGGQRIFPRILSAMLPNPPGTPPDLLDRRVILQLDQIGDFSIYTLTVGGPDIDPFFNSRKLRFRLGCDEPFDCRPPVPTSAAPDELAVVIDYLAKDYSGFRQALLDFIPTRLPAWIERSEADIGVMLLELLAATADTLSYLQDRVANEAFLETATQRRSVAGHLALIDYQMDQGASAYTWLQFQVNAVQTLPSNPGLRVSTRKVRDNDPVIVFETHGAVTVRPKHNVMPVYVWNNANCCLPQTALSLALAGSYPDLRQGEYLLLDDGQGQRDVVRLTRPPAIIPAKPADSSPDGNITLIYWSKTTPLRHAYCVRALDDLTQPRLVVRGNLAPATHGETILPGESLREQGLRLRHAPLAYLRPDTPGLPEPRGTAGLLPTRQPRGISTLTLRVEGFAQPWREMPSLLDSQPNDPHFRVEIEDAGDATIVFGTGLFGLEPSPTAKITASYRVGGGAVGNVAADTLVQVRPREGEVFSWLDSVTNPPPAVGGRDLESREHARRFAPQTFKNPLVAVTAADYQAAAEAFSDDNGEQPVQRARAAFRWTGSWLTVTLDVDPRDASRLDADLHLALRRYLDTRRLAGYDLEIIRAVYVPLELEIGICLKAGFRPGDVEQALLQTLGGTDLPGGKKGFFHPDNFTFGQNLPVSRIYAAVMSVTGVDSAHIKKFCRFHTARPERETAINLAQGFLAVGPHEIIRLDNNRNFPQNGTLSIRTKGVGS